MQRRERRPRELELLQVLNLGEQRRQIGELEQRADEVSAPARQLQDLRQKKSILGSQTVACVSIVLWDGRRLRLCRRAQSRLHPCCTHASIKTTWWTNLAAADSIAQERLNLLSGDARQVNLKERRLGLA